MKKLKMVMVLILFFCICACAQKEESVKEEDETEISEYEHVILAEMSVIDYGTVKIELYPDVAPITVENFVNLVKDGFYDGNRFHRIIDGFMIQGGMDTTGTVKKIKGEFSSNGVENNLKHKDGVISMARANDPDSATSQFFIMVGDGYWLDGDYAAFGQVVEGYDVVKQIAADAKPVDNNGTIKEEEMPVIEWIRIVE